MTTVSPVMNAASSEARKANRALSLAELGHSHTGAAGGELQVVDLRDLVCLGVGPQGDAGITRDGRHARDVALQAVEVAGWGCPDRQWS
jgi:hypothetical protein